MKEKQKLIQDLNDAFAKNDIPLILDCMSEHIEWVMVGGNTTKGKADIEREMTAMTDVKMIEMNVDNIIINGNLATANGSFKINEAGEAKDFGFCDVYEFNEDDKIKKMTCYVIPLKK